MNNITSKFGIKIINIRLKYRIMINKIRHLLNNKISFHRVLLFYNYIIIKSEILKQVF